MPSLSPAIQRELKIHVIDLNPSHPSLIALDLTKPLSSAKVKEFRMDHVIGAYAKATEHLTNIYAPFLLLRIPLKTDRKVPVFTCVHTRPS